MSGIVPEWSLEDRLRKARMVAGLDQSVLAAMLSVSRSTVIKYEAGDFPTAPRLHAHLARKVHQWAEATGVDPEWLLTGTVTEEAE